MADKKHYYDLTEAIEIIERLKAERGRLRAELERARAEGERLIEKWRAHAKRLRRDKQPNVADMADDCADELYAAMGKGGRADA